ncbi:MFS transporter [Corynebacterium epidermidicanis]|uniref:MFS transporter n=1 Tax=Corynebacterium epidermidicanis TaxID=1050174 RepID=UPI00069BD396|nr:MFS transporter [Corynebacterium epidermidicanis]
MALLFASNGMMIAGMLPWYPMLKSRFTLDDSLFGLLVACVAVGSLLSMGLPARLVRGQGPRSSIVWGTLLMSLAVQSVALVPSAWFLAIVLLAVGFLDPFVDVAQNVLGVQVEEAFGRSVMSSWHACWSLGAAASGFVGTWAVGHVPLAAHLAGNSVLSFLVAALGCVMLGSRWDGQPGQPADSRLTDAAGDPATRQSESDPDSRSLGAKTAVGRVFPLALIAMSAIGVEEIANSWAALSAHEVAGIPVERAGVALTVMFVAQCVGRFVGDPMINRLGRENVARIGGASIALGGIIVIMAAAPSLWLVGLAVAGFGCATIVPSTFVAAAAIPGLRKGEGITIVSWLMRVGFLATSPLIGLVSTATSLRVALGILVLAGITIFIFSRRLAPTVPRV